MKEEMISCFDNNVVGLYFNSAFASFLFQLLAIKAHKMLVTPCMVFVMYAYICYKYFTNMFILICK